MDQGADLCFPNLEEGALLGGAKDRDRIVQELLRYYPGVILKLGVGGALCTSTDEERVRLPATPARVIDTTGAGDALCAGFLAAWLSGVPPAEALQRSIELAARVVEQVGSRP
jgi:sugar/nucleoside kinase (ribokinase family)